MNSATKRCRKRHESERVSRNKKDDCFALLPDDLIIDILQKLPPDVLRYKTKLVCKRWFNLITNKILLDHASLILEMPDGCHKVRLIDIREENEGLEMKDQYLDIPFGGGHIKAWCNEFILITDHYRAGYLYVLNIITKEGSLLAFPIVCGGHFAGKCGLGLSYDEFKGVYKIVHVFMGPPIQCELLTFKSSNIGSSCSTKWKKIDGLGSSCSTKWKKIDGPSYTGQRKYYWDDPVSVQGRYFHWDVHCCKYLVSMDTVKEKFSQTCLPVPDLFPANNRYSFVEMGGYLTLLYKVSPEIINIWMLKDFQKTKWEKMHSIAVTSSVISSIYPGSCLPRPITSLKSRRYIIFRKPGSDSGLYGYDRKDEVMKRLDIVIKPMERCVVPTAAAGFFKVR